MKAICCDRCRKFSELPVKHGGDGWYALNEAYYFNVDDKKEILLCPDCRTLFEIFMQGGRKS